MKIYLVRHTAVGCPPGMCYGQTDVPLKETFEEEAAVVKKNLSGILPDIVYSSPLSRCRRLAAFCGYANPVLDDRLKEIHFGDWETQRWDDMDMSAWEKDWVDTPAPNGESFMMMYDRVADFFDTLKREKNYQSVIIFTHGGVISCARVYFEQADIRRTFELMPAYGEVVAFEY
ncbi:alpha-ribazole phosphatase [Parabacteroides sp. OttesenSCG-928-J18]|nr:alpha-ribazole phosphatase [Parabacteroides sp. OttesenSCG-928-J18]